MNVEPDAPASLAADVGNPWYGVVSVWTRTVFGWAWSVGIYGLPAGTGSIDPTLWNRRVVLFAPAFITILFARWAWVMGKHGSLSEFSSQVRDNAKSVRAFLPQSAQIVQLWGHFTGYTVCCSFNIFVLGDVYMDILIALRTYRWQKFPPPVDSVLTSSSAP